MAVAGCYPYCAWNVRPKLLPGARHTRCALCPGHSTRW
ncbi:MAG: hypothetical protein H0U76_09335 [Ktedonobacteraceae bacterium]|nr:hypothetical protein [Ktedonobacteraceae bacterium]